MKFFLSFSLFWVINIVIAQCPYKIDIDILEWEGKTATLKWKCEPIPTSGQLDIYRTCLTLNKDDEKWIGSTGIAKRGEFSDTYPALKPNWIYQYRLQLSSNKKCFAIKSTQGRVIEDDTSTNISVKSIKSYIQRDIVVIKSQKLSSKTSTYLPIEVVIKDLNFEFSNKLIYALIYGNDVIETDAQVIDDDFRFANVYIIDNSSRMPKFKIALIQDNEILGVSPLIQKED